MAVRWPDGSYTGSVKVATSEPAPVEPPANEPTQIIAEPSFEKKEVAHGDR